MDGFPGGQWPSGPPESGFEEKLINGLGGCRGSSSTSLEENEGFHGSGGLESGPPGPDFEGFRGEAAG